MISSMTGFGRGEVRNNGLSVLVEVRSLNHRFLDVDIRIPKNMTCMEVELKELISKRLSRGRVNLTVNIKGEHTAAASMKIDTGLAVKYIEALKNLKSELGLEGTIQLDRILALPDIVSFENSEDLEKKLQNAVKNAATAAIEELIKMRNREGVEIKKDLIRRIHTLNDTIVCIEKRSVEKSSETYQQLLEKVHELVHSSTIDEQRIETEVALLAEKMDVTEECIRFKSHNTIFLELLEDDESQGRRMNFLLQEMHREVNTIGAKAADSQVAHWVVAIKEDVEKLREQIQNIE